MVRRGTTSLERRELAESIQAERGLVMIPPFDHPDIIAGQGTVGVEILEDWPEVEAILVPIGGGGLISGIAAWVKRERPEVAVVGVEPEGAPTLRRALDAGAVVTLEQSGSIADGLIPVRLFYPGIEESLNRAAVEAARARQGGATLNSPVWWMGS